jgi:ubiquinone/menaquinone biosynthesis C-methylase UbiE
VNAGQRFARFVTDVVVRRPALWRLFRGLMRRQFDKLAPVWDTMRSPDAFAPVEAALAALPGTPKTILDLGTGTGSVAQLVAARFPGADVTGVDVSPKMVAIAREKVPGVRFEVGDAGRLPYGDGAFELVTLGNMIPFFGELARITAPGGHVLFSFSAGDETPIYVPAERLRRELAERGFADFADFSAGRGTAFLARRR